MSVINNQQSKIFLAQIQNQPQFEIDRPFRVRISDRNVQEINQLYREADYMLSSRVIGDRNVAKSLRTTIDNLKSAMNEHLERKKLGASEKDQQLIKSSKVIEELYDEANHYLRGMNKGRPDMTL